MGDVRGMLSHPVGTIIVCGRGTRFEGAGVTTKATDDAFVATLIESLFAAFGAKGGIVMLIRFGNLLVNDRNLVTVALNERGVILQLNVAAHVAESIQEDPRIVVLEGPEGTAARRHFMERYPDLTTGVPHAT